MFVCVFVCVCVCVSLCGVIETCILEKGLDWIECNSIHIQLPCIHEF